MGYREHAAPAALRPWLECLWLRRADDSGPHAILPDGCVDVVWTEGAGTRIVGANTAAFAISLATNTRVAGARLRPGAAASLLAIDAESVRDARPAIDQLWGDDGARLAMMLDERTDPIAALSAALLERARQAERPDPLVDEAVSRLRSPRVAVSALAGELGVSERQLRRRFTAAVGYAPKLLARVLRLQSALASARAGGDLSRAAFDAGYADQAHFANDCRALAGATPSTLIGIVADSSKTTDAPGATIEP